MNEAETQDLLSARFLARIPLFQGFSLAELSDLRSAMQVERKPAGSTIIRQGQIGGQDFYVLVEGSVVVQENGVIVANRKPYAPIGELAFITNRKRTATVQAETDCVLLRVDAEKVRAVIQKNPMVAWKLMEAIARLLCDRWAELDNRVRELLAEAPELQERYAKVREEALSISSPKGEEE